MKRTRLNFVVDAAAFVAFLFLATTGALVRFVLPPGSGHTSTLWGMSRHGWGELHFWIAVALVSILALHLVLHWGWIVGMVRADPREGAGARVALSLVGVVALVGLALAPFFGEVTPTGIGPGTDTDTDTEAHAPATTEGSPLPIDGSLTLDEVEQLTGVPVATMLRELQLPDDLPSDARLSTLRKLHGVELHAVRAVVAARASAH